MRMRSAVTTLVLAAVSVLAVHSGARAAAITSGTEVDAVAGVPLSYQITADNAPTSFSTSGLSSISGLTLNKNTGLISGTPTETGTFNVTVDAKGAINTATKRIKFVITPQMVDFTSANTASGAISTAFSFQLAAPVTKPKYGASGLPSGLRVSSSTGLITGTPTTPGIYAVTVTASNATMIASAILSITINGGVATPTSVGLTPVTATVGTAYIGALKMRGSGPVTFTTTALPAGLSMTSNSNFITGTPTTAGVTSITITATNSFGSSSATVTFTVAPPNGAPLITSPLSVTGEVGESFFYDSTSAGKSPIVFSVDPTLLPRGLAQDSSGNIGGVPFDPGVFITPFSAANAFGSDNQTLTITVASLAPGNIGATIKFTDGYKDAKQAGGVMPTSSFMFTAVVNTPGLTPTLFDSKLNVDVTVGLYEFSKTLGSASNSGRFNAGKSALFNITTTHNGKTVRLGNISFTLKNAQVKIVAHLKGTKSIGGVQTIHAEQFTGQNKLITETIPVKIQLGTNYLAAFYMNATGTAAVKNVRDGFGGTDALSTVKLKGGGSGSPSN